MGKNTLIAVVSSLIIGAAMGYLFSKNSKKTDLVGLRPEAQSAKTLQSLKNKIKSLSELELQEYLKLRDQQQKFNKANEILGKMMSIFVAELGIKFSKQEIASFKKSAEEILAIAPTSCEAEKVSCREQLKEQERKYVEQQRQTQIKTSAWKLEEKKLSEIFTEDEAKKFLDSVVIDDFFSEIRKGKIVNKANYEKLIGIFVGKIVFDDHERAPADAKMFLDAAYENNKITGKAEIVLSRKGKEFSKSTGDGAIDNFQQPAGTDSKALFVNLGGRMGYLQLYFVNNNATLIGNYYKEEKVGEYSRAGNITLYRR